MVINFHHLTESQIAKWGAWIKFLVSEAPILDTDTIPEVSVYPTMFHSFVDNFRKDRVENDAMLADWYAGKVWAYCILRDGDTVIGAKKIVLCLSNMENNVKKVLPIEFNFLHEIGHFNIMRRRLPDKSNRKEDEHEADRYALIQYLKILKKYPVFRTATTHSDAHETDNIFRGYLTKYRGKKIEEFADKIMESLGWTKPELS